MGCTHGVAKSWTLLSTLHIWILKASCWGRGELKDSQTWVRGLTCAACLRKESYQGRTWREGLRGAYLGEARGLWKLGAHMSLIHANQRSVQFLSSLQVTFGQRTLAECGVQSREVSPPGRPWPHPRRPIPPDLP